MRYTSRNRRTIGLGIAAVTAVISGFAVFVNSYGVQRFDDATTYTTAKNLVAGLLLVGLLGMATARRTGAGFTAPRTGRHRLGLLAVGVVGGSIPFVLFFEGLARAGSTDAAFIHKTLVAWVALLAVFALRERLTPVHVGAIGLILFGQAAVRGGVGLPEAGSGELMILAATWLWAAEVVVAKRLLAELSPLTVGATRMGLGSAVLVGWALVSGRVGDLLALSGSQIGWALLTGAILTGYVATWHYALSMAPAVDVTAILVAGAVITALLNGAIKGVALSPQLAGLVFIGCGVAAVAVLGARQLGARQRSPVPS